MVMFLKRRSSKNDSEHNLTCPRCGMGIRGLKFIETQGGDLDIYKCKRCNTPIRYMTTPFDPANMTRREAARQRLQGMHNKELVRLPGIGNFMARRHRVPKD